MQWLARWELEIVHEVGYIVTCRVWGIDPPPRIAPMAWANLNVKYCAAAQTSEVGLELVLLVRLVNASGCHASSLHVLGHACCMPFVFAFHCIANKVRGAVWLLLGTLVMVMLTTTGGTTSEDGIRTAMMQDSGADEQVVWRKRGGIWNPFSIRPPPISGVFSLGSLPVSPPAASAQTPIKVSDANRSRRRQRPLIAAIEVLRRLQTPLVVGW